MCHPLNICTEKAFQTRKAVAIIFVYSSKTRCKLLNLRFSNPYLRPFKDFIHEELTSTYMYVYMNRFWADILYSYVHIFMFGELQIGWIEQFLIIKRHFPLETWHTILAVNDKARIAILLTFVHLILEATNKRLSNQTDT